jgi:hypothetical protein
MKTTGWLARWREVEVIGQPECPLLLRRTLLSTRCGKVLLHEFLPTARDRDPHDHPSSFLTLVLRGGYDDVRPDGTIDRLHAPAIRFRRAEHTHTTISHHTGATTLVVMGPKRRAWGFLRAGRWLPWRTYEEEFGHGFRCDDAPPREAGVTTDDLT